MAARTRRSKVQPPEIATTKVVYRGDNKELYGQSFVVPVSIKNKARFIEQQVAKKREEEEAAALAAAQAEVAPVEVPVVAEPPEPVVTLQPPSSDTPDSDAQLALSLSLSNLMSNLLVQSQKTESLQQEVGEMMAEVAVSLEKVKNGAAEKEAALALVRQSQEFLSGVAQSTGKQIGEMQQEVNKASLAVTQMKVEADANKELIRDAANISRDFDAVLDARVESIRQETKQQMLAFANNLFRVVGIDRNMALQALNAANVDRRNVMNQGEFDMLLSTFQAANEGFKEQETATIQNSRTAADLLGHSGGMVKDA